MAAVNLPLAVLLQAAGLPPAEHEYRFHPTRRWRWDAAWPQREPGLRPVALEIQGGIWSRGRHVRGRGYELDIEKLVEGQLRGWVVIWASTRQLESGEAIAWLRRALEVG